MDSGNGTLFKEFLRSDVLIQLTDYDIKLLFNNITTIVDLKSNEEVQCKPCALKCNIKFEYYHCKVHGDGYLPAIVEAEMVRLKMKLINSMG